VSSRVVVVDDNRDAAEMLSFALAAAGHEVKTAFDGPSALEVVTEHRPALVFLDIGLPVMDGYEVARRIRSTSEGRAIMLVAMTGYGQDSDKQLAAEAGFDRHFVKPVTLETSLALAADVARRAAAQPE